MCNLMRYITKFAPIVAIATILAGCGSGKGKFIKDIVSDYNSSVTAERFAQALAFKNYRLVSKIDQEQVAKGVDIFLYPTLTLNINNPKISATFIKCNPSMALEMPIRVSVYNELNGTTHLAYTNPEYWSLKHNIKDSRCIELVNLVARDLDEATDSIKKGKR